MSLGDPDMYGSDFSVVCSENERPHKRTSRKSTNWISAWSTVRMKEAIVPGRQAIVPGRLQTGLQHGLQ